MAGGTDNVVAYISAGLKAAGMRSRVIGNNIANLNRANFRRSDIRFDELVAKALEGADDAELAKAVYQPKLDPVDGRGNDVNLDTEIGEMMKNGAKAQVYLRALAKVYSQIDLAVRDRF